MTDPSPRSSRAALAGCAALLLPLLAAADSQLVAESNGRALRSSAHLDFKIVIPRVLSMDLGAAVDEASLGAADDERRLRGGEPVAIYANSHNATLAASLPASDQARGNVILSSAARKVISQNALCAPGMPYSLVSPIASSVSARRAELRVVCTASTP